MLIGNTIGLKIMDFDLVLYNMLHINFPELAILNIDTYQKGMHSMLAYMIVERNIQRGLGL